MKKATRKAYGEALVELGEKNPDVVVLDADLSKSTNTIMFKKEFPERFFNIGISEQDLMGTAAGFAAAGKIPFASTFAMFAAGRAFEQIRNSIAYPHLNVKICPTHAGITVGEDGGSHQSIEDIALMRSIPGMVVISPADAVETRLAVLAAAEYEGPVYIRLGRFETEVIYDEKHTFEIGKAHLLKEVGSIAIVATGIMVAEALLAAEILSKEGIDAGVINMSTIKPLDGEMLMKAASKADVVFTVEEHSVIGGLGGAVAEFLSYNKPVKVVRIGVEDRFGESGKGEELLEAFGLKAGKIADRIKKEIKILIGTQIHADLYEERRFYHR